jgi:two-component system, LytTR family, sensor kinase
LEHTIMKNQLLDSKIKSLQSQIHPHFLFNTLNGISSLMEIDILKSQDAISDLSSLLRNSLELNKVKFHSIEDEFNLLQHYINIEKIRFDEKLSFKTFLDDDVLNFQIPPLILQPIVENSIKHGFSYNHDKIEVCIKVEKHKSYIIFEVENNGKLLENDDVHFGNGLKNVIERVHTVYKDDCSFKINNTKNKTVLVTLKLPQKH